MVAPRFDMHYQATTIRIDGQRTGHFHCGGSRTIQIEGRRKFYGGWEIESTSSFSHPWVPAEQNSHDAVQKGNWPVAGRKHRSLKKVFPAV